jgi:tellurite methyltransferase
MRRTIQGFLRDDEGAWVARLDCGHGRHFRHAPPASVRPWVEDAAERALRVGTSVDCHTCDRSEWPDGAVRSGQSKWFTETTVPDALLHDHTTRSGTWGKVVVTSGSLRLIAGDPAPCNALLDATTSGVVVPQHPHRVELTGPVRFQVEFYRVPELS